MESKAVVKRLELHTGIELSYTSSGPSGTLPVLLLHGWAESRRAFDQLRAFLPNTVRVIAVDQRGHGDADVPETGYSLTDFANDVEAFMDAASLPSAILMGASSGGYVAQQCRRTSLAPHCDGVCRRPSPASGRSALV